MPDPTSDAPVLVLVAVYDQRRTHVDVRTGPVHAGYESTGAAHTELGG